MPASAADMPISPVTQAVVLVGGKGTRLGSLTQNVPKPLLEIAPNLRFLDTLLFELARHGFNDIVLLAGHLGEQVEAAYQNRRVLDAAVRVVRELEPQGTGGALKFAEGILDPWFLMANGNSLFEFNFRALAADRPLGMIGRLALRDVADPARYGAVEVDNGRITKFREKDPSLKGPALINGGVYLLSRDILAHIPGACSIEADVFPRLASEGRLEGRAFDGYFLDIGLPDTLAQARLEIPGRKVRPCAFLDRDGVINVDAGYTFRAEDLRFVTGAAKAIRRLNDSGYYVIVVSNQAGVARGLYSEADIAAFHREISVQLADVGAHIDAYYYCPFHPEGVLEQYCHPDHPDRKPNPGMILRAKKDWPIDVTKSFLIGDRSTDLEAAAAAGLPGILFEGGDLDELMQRQLAG
ncbi:MAG: HAD-IIIA family hydrolase [Hyphomonadaceae bacterium]